MGSCNLALLFNKEDQWEETCGPSIPRLRNWGGGQLDDPQGIKTSLWRRGRAVLESRQMWEEHCTQGKG